jgi:hypothetical protein
MRDRQTMRPMWYTGSELLLIGIHNRKMLTRHGLSRGLELIHDEMCGNPLERFQRSHTQRILALQCEQKVAGAMDEESIQRLSSEISEVSLNRALLRGAQDFMDAAQELDATDSVNCAVMPKRVRFGKTSIICQKDVADLQGYQNDSYTWYTESELRTIEVHNQEMAKAFGASRGLELVHDELYGQVVEKFQRGHTQSIMALQREQQGEGICDEEALRTLSVAITQESSWQAQHRATVDFMDAAGVAVLNPKPAAMTSSHNGINVARSGVKHETTKHIGGAAA